MTTKRTVYYVPSSFVRPTCNGSMAFVHFSILLIFLLTLVLSGPLRKTINPTLDERLTSVIDGLSFMPISLKDLILVDTKCMIPP